MSIPVRQYVTTHRSDGSTALVECTHEIVAPDGTRMRVPAAFARQDDAGSPNAMVSVPDPVSGEMISVPSSIAQLMQEYAALKGGLGDAPQRPPLASQGEDPVAACAEPERGGDSITITRAHRTRTSDSVTRADAAAIATALGWDDRDCAASNEIERLRVAAMQRHVSADAASRTRTPAGDGREYHADGTETLASIRRRERARGQKRVRPLIDHDDRIAVAEALAREGYGR